MAEKHDASGISDQTILEFVRRQGSATVGDLVEYTSVTATAVRQRLTRLMEHGMLQRSKVESTGRGRPTHKYQLTQAGVRSAGTNFAALAQALWDEIRDLKAPEVQRGLLDRVSRRLAESCGDEISGDTSVERMESLAEFMNVRRLPFEIEEQADGRLPVLKALACPYPDLAERDRSICAMEKLMFSAVVGQPLRLSACRLDGDGCCTFEANNSTN